MIDKDTALGFRKDSTSNQYAKMRENVLSELKRSFNPEFLNRVDEVVVFHPLTNDHLLQIVDMLVAELNAQMLLSRNIHVEVGSDVKEWLIQENYQPTYGARPMRRAIQKHITDPLSEEMLRGRFKEAQKILVTMKDGIIAFHEEEAGLLAKV
jgi:ATP-dependent Clp protease ATP-binding subunit ClpC